MMIVMIRMKMISMIKVNVIMMQMKEKYNHKKTERKWPRQSKFTECFHAQLSEFQC